MKLHAQRGLSFFWERDWFLWTVKCYRPFLQEKVMELYEHVVSD